MTSEAAIITRKGIALASDSAVTFGWYKTKYSENKIFKLSDRNPIAIMIYGKASFMGIPWEVIIKDFREIYGNKTFDNLEEYGVKFIEYISNISHITPRQKAKEIYFITDHFLTIILRDITDYIEKKIEEGEQFTEYKIKRVIAQQIKNVYSIIQEIPFIENIEKTDMDRFRREHEELIDGAIKYAFGELPLFEYTKKDIRKLMAAYFSRQYFPPVMIHSGIVIAGYGKEEIFPQLCHYRIENLLFDWLKYWKEESEGTGCSFEKGAIVKAFAQKEMIFSFMEGIEENLQDYYDTYIEELFSELPQMLTECIPDLDEDEKEEVNDIFTNIFNNLFDKYVEDLAKYRKKEYADKTVQVVKSLPKKDMADMARALVDLQSFKRKVSQDLETVGGPIDVAFISRGDGFVWINRKNYFKPELNPHKYLNENPMEEENE